MAGSDKNTFHYQESAITSARPEELMLMMYNGLLKFILRAQEEIREKRLEAAHNTLLRCQDIVFEFQYTLNMDYAVSNNLMLLYDYLYNRLIEANAKKDCAILDEVLGFVNELRDTWVEAVRINGEGKSAAVSGVAADIANPAPSVKAIYKKSGAQMNIASASPQYRFAQNDASPEDGGEAEATDAIEAAETAVTADANATAAVGAAIGVVNIGAVGGAVNAATAELTSGDVVDIPVALPGAFGQAAAAARMMSNPANRMNPAVAAQYAKVSKSKAPPLESISIASK